MFCPLDAKLLTGYWKATGPNQFIGRGTQVADFCRGFSTYKSPFFIFFSGFLRIFPENPENPEQKQKKTKKVAASENQENLGKTKKKQEKTTKRKET